MTSPSGLTERAAVLAMDCQAGLVSVYAKPPEEFAARASQVLQSARSAGLPVVHVQVGFRPGLPEISPRNKIFASLKSSAQHQKLFEGAAGAVHPALGPEPGDIVITKHRVSAFAGTDLAMVLRAKEISTVVLFGIATSGVVLSTLLEACDADFKIVVISDCCADLDTELHDALLNRLFPRRADVLTAADFVKSLQPSDATP
ncbi:MAG TPA: isochorismatase family cysteine hydrolase [Bryobacteraceae bacterium]|jgi:nicotinamidase-related amidase|nr:isochorismatase family cysteine hydrolase [Bryobacteraceae bacterium]